MKEFSNKPEGLKKLSGGEFRESAVSQDVEKKIDAHTPVLHVEGSKLYHVETACSELVSEEEQFGRHGISRLFGQMNDVDELGPCPLCAKENVP